LPGIEYGFTRNYAHSTLDNDKGNGKLSTFNKKEGKNFRQSQN